MNSTAYENSIVLKIDEANRSIKYDGKSPLILGVKGDDCAERVYFEAPRYLSPEIDLMDTTEGTEICVYVNYKNASNEPYIQECSDKASVANTDTVNFSWLVTNRATHEKGEVKFNVCVKKFVDGVLTNEWHTTTFTGKVLDGIDVTAKTPEVITHDTVTLQALTLEVQNYAGEVAGYETALNNLNESLSDVNQYVDEVVDDTVQTHVTKITDSTNVWNETTQNNIPTKLSVANYVSTSLPQTTTILDDMSHEIPVWNTTDSASAMSLLLGEQPPAGSKLKLYFGGNGYTTYADDRTFVLEINVVDVNGSSFGQTSHHIRIGDAYEGVLFVKLWSGPDTKQLFFSVVTKLYDATGINNLYSSEILKFILTKIEMITGPGI